VAIYESGGWTTDSIAASSVSEDDLISIIRIFLLDQFVVSGRLSGG
jgi:hypothetical protein